MQIIPVAWQSTLLPECLKGVIMTTRGRQVRVGKFMKILTGLEALTTYQRGWQGLYNGFSKI